jgi:hypothetical protein
MGPEIAVSIMIVRSRYIALFYVAFWELDIEKLRGELVSLYTVDSMRRVATESVIPFLQREWEKFKVRRALVTTKKTDDSDGDALSSEGAAVTRAPSTRLKAAGRAALFVAKAEVIKPPCPLVTLCAHMPEVETGCYEWCTRHIHTLTR